MPRLVMFEGDGPYELPPQPRSAWLCGCGLSKNRPHCDGSHKRIRAEPEGAVCVYDLTGSRISCTTEQLISNRADQENR
jgi:CDGSH-type Zn-finger protein